MKRILLLLLPFLPYLATAQVAKDTVTVLTIADIPAGAIRDTTNITFVQDNAFKKATFDSLAKYTRVKLVGDRGDITVSGATGLTWELDAGVVDSMQLSAGAVVLPGAKVVGTLPVNKGGTGSTTQNFVDLTSNQTIGGVKTYTSLLQAPRALYQSAVTGGNPIVWFDNQTTTTDQSFGILIDAGTSELDYALRIRNANNSELMRVNGIGNVGIGTDAPTAALHLKAGTTTVPPLRLTANTGSFGSATAGEVEFNGTNLFFTPSTTRNIIPQISGSTALTTGSIPFATSNGYLTSASNLFYAPPDGTYNYGRLAVNAQIANQIVYPLLVRALDIGPTLNVDSYGTNIATKGTGAFQGPNANGLFTISFHEQSRTPFFTSNFDNADLVFVTRGGSVTSEKIRITSTGNLGIGTSTPTSNLEVAQSTTGPGTVSISNGSTTVTGVSTQFTNTFKVGDNITVSGQTVRTITAITNNTSLTVNSAYTTTATNLSYTLTGGTRFVVKGNGNVGIGVTPTEKLHVNGNAIITGAYDNTDASQANVVVLSTGALRRSTASSIRYKNNVSDWDESGLNLINQLKPKTYNYKAEHFADTSKTFLGLIAEDVQAVSDYLVDYSEGKVDNVRYANIVVPLIKAIQEQQAIIEDLKTRIIKLENK